MKNQNKTTDVNSNDNKSLINYKLYDDEFYTANASNEHVLNQSFFVDIVYNLIHPKSVIDLGCGVGGALSLFKNKYHCSVQGLDGDYVDRNLLLIDNDDFTSFNLEDKLPINAPFLKNERYDLAISTEVAEHLPPSRGESFVDDLTRLSDCVLFSAAVPMQGGTNHVNERPLEYWVNLFEKHNYTPISCVRPLFKNCTTNEELIERGCGDFWYANNLILFIKSNCLEKYNINPKDYEDNWMNIPVMQQHITGVMIMNWIKASKNKSKLRCMVMSCAGKILKIL